MNQLTLMEWLLIVETVVFSGTLIATVIQNFLTRRTVEEMEKSRKVQFMPRIKASLYFAGPTYVELKAQNAGKGPAIDINAVIKTQPTEEERKWQQSLMASDEFRLFFLPEGNFEKLAEKFDFVIIEGSCMDIFGGQHKIDERIDLKEQLKDLARLEMVWKEDPLEKIGKTLEKIERKLR